MPTAQISSFDDGVTCGLIGAEWIRRTMFCPELRELWLDIARGKYHDWQSFANDMAEDRAVIERVLETHRKGTR